VTLTPVRRWEIFLVLHSHTDLGFTAPVSEVAQIHNDNTDQAIIFCRETANWPEGSRFKWTCEVSWQVENYLRDRSPGQIEELMNLIGEGAIEIGALYSGELFELLGHEEAVRSLYLTGKLRQRFNIPIDTAVLGDVPGCPMGFVQMMAKSGIHNFIMADNNFTAPFLARTDLPRPFFWEGADGTDVLAWYTDHPFYAYWEGNLYGFADSYSRVRRNFPGKLVELETSGYPFNAYQVQYAFDNFRLDFRPAVIVREWNERWAYPRIRLATAGEFLNHLRHHHKTEIPRRRGDWSTWWTRIATHYPNDTALSRTQQERAPQMETLSTFIAGFLKEAPSLQDEFETIYHQLLTFDEHTAGGLVWFSDDQDLIRQSAREGFGFVHHARSKLDLIQKSLGESLVKLIDTQNRQNLLAVYNSLNWPRSEVVEFEYPKDMENVALRDTISGSVLPAERLPGQRIRFKTTKIPPFGYHVFEIIPDTFSKKETITDAHIKLRANDILLENKFYRLEIDSRSGWITSIFDKLLEQDLCKESPFALNQFVVYEVLSDPVAELGKFIPEIYNGTKMPGHFRQFPEQSRFYFEKNEETVGGALCMAKHTINGQVWLTQEVRLEHGERMVRISNRLHREAFSHPKTRELLKDLWGKNGMCYFVFPFNVPGGELCFESTGGVMAPAADQFKGACREHFTARSWVQIANDQISVAFCSPDVPLFDIAEPGVGKYHTELPADHATIFARVYASQQWGEDKESPYSKEEDLQFRFIIGGYPPGETRKTGATVPALMPAYRLGWNVQQPLIAIPLEDDTPGPLPLSRSFCKIKPEGVQLMTFKKAEFGKGNIIRIREILGIKSRVHITFPERQIVSANRAMMTEETLEPLEIRGNMIVVELNAYAIETIRIFFQEK
jgi:hypothetical protein